MVNNKLYSIILFIAACTSTYLPQVEAAQTASPAPANPPAPTSQETRSTLRCSASSCGDLKKFTQCLSNPDFKVEDHPNCMQSGLNAIRGLSLTSITTGKDSDAVRQALPEGLYSLLKDKAPWMLPETRSKDFLKTHTPDLKVLPGCPILICSFDGGGIKGIIPATVIADIERQLKVPITEVCDIFVGTSTGGLIAAFLTVPDEQGKQKYTADEMVRLYTQLARKVFDTKGVNWLRAKTGIFRSKYSADSLIKILKEKLGYARMSDAVKPLVVTSYDMIQKSNFPISSRYGILSPKMDLFLYEAGRATSAAPTFFPAFDVTLGASIRLKLADGGLMANDPALVAMLESWKIYPGRSYKVLSLGTGEYSSKKTPKNSGVIDMLAPTVEALFKGPMQLTREVISASLPEENYYRFSPVLTPKQDAMDNVKSDNIRSLQAAAREQILESDRYKHFIDTLKTELILKKYLQAINNFINGTKDDTYFSTLKKMESRIQSQLKANNKSLEGAYRSKHRFEKIQVLGEARLIPDLRIRKAFIQWIINGEVSFEWALEQNEEGEEHLDTVLPADLQYIKKHPEVYTNFLAILQDPKTLRKSLSATPMPLDLRTQLSPTPQTSPSSGMPMGLQVATNTSPAPSPSWRSSAAPKTAATPVQGPGTTKLGPKSSSGVRLSAAERASIHSAFSQFGLHPVNSAG